MKLDIGDNTLSSPYIMQIYQRNKSIFHGGTKINCRGLAT